MSTYYHALKEPWSDIKIEETSDSYVITYGIATAS